MVCLDPELDEPPEGKWACPSCEKNGPPVAVSVFSDLYNWVTEQGRRNDFEITLQCPASKNISQNIQFQSTLPTNLSCSIAPS